MTVQEVPIILGGKERGLRFKFRAWAALEDHGHHAFTIMQEFTPEDAPPSFKMLRLLLWAMLRHEQPAPSVEEIDNWLDETPDIGAVIAKIGEALTHSFPDAEGNGRPLEAAAPGTGPLPDSSPTVPSS